MMMIRARRRLAARSRARRLEDQHRERAAAAERQRRSRHRRKMMALNYEEVVLWLPPEIKAAWEARERASDPQAVLAVEHYKQDLADLLVEWSRRWIDARHVRDAAR
jgi:hypothetical protein